MRGAPPEDIGQLLNLVSNTYSYRVNQCGPVANGVFWKDQDGQMLRYELLLQAIDDADLSGPISVNDLGCGYGALFDLLADQPMMRSEEHTSELQSHHELVCRLLLEKKNCNVCA